MLTTLKKVLECAERGGYAVPAFNINNMEIAQAVIAGALCLKSPVIMQTSEGAIKYAGMNYLKALVMEAAKEKVPVVFHLDHGKDLKVIKKAIDSGYTSVMIDASLFPYKKNVSLTKKVVALARRKGVSVEAELGAIEGVEDLVSVSERQAFFTSPDEARRFVKETRCDALAISIGTAHGAYKFKGKPRLDLSRLREIKKVVNVPLVLHGASEVPAELVRLANFYGADLAKTAGVSDLLLRQAIKYGIRKVNTDTDLRMAFNAGIRKALAKDKKVFDPRKIFGPAREEMQKVVLHRIRACGSAGRA